MALATSPVSSADRFLFHKTTYRAVYDQHRAKHSHVFDVLLWNEQGELTEFTIGNLVLRIDGVNWTPPRECALLAGTFRAELLERGEIRERVMRVEDLRGAEAVWLINSIREWVPMTGIAAIEPR
jgi:para-aminobenzoate synthetase/4-amino-4-deoxychorismate lyase